MSHEVASMAYVNATPWHGLGNRLTPGQPIEVWQEQAGMNWRINEAEVLFNAPGSEGQSVKSHAECKVLFRDDSLVPLSVVSRRYRVVQPQEVLGFFRDLVSVGGFELETAGVLKGGRKLWALAKTGEEVVLRGGDQVKSYLLLATSCDGTMSTKVMPTSVRVVCNNTLQIAVNDDSHALKVPHSTTFDADLVKMELGIGMGAWQTFIGNIKQLADRKINKIEAMNYLVKVLGDPQVPLVDQPNQKALQAVHALFMGEGKGSGLASASGTVWGLLNGVTQYVDQVRKARNQDYRLDSAWFGQGAAIKKHALEEALKLAA